MSSRFSYIEILFCRLHQKSTITNGKTESEAESDHITNGVCDGFDASQPVTVDSDASHSSQQLPLSAHDVELPSYAALPDELASDGTAASNDGDVLNGNYMSSVEDQIPSPPTRTSLSSEEAAQKPEVSLDEDLTAKFLDRGDVAELEDLTGPSLVSIEVPGDQQGTKHAIPPSVPHELVSDVDMSDSCSKPQFLDRGDVPELEDLSKPTLVSDVVPGEQQGTKHAIPSSVPHELVSDAQPVSGIGSRPQFVDRVDVAELEDDARPSLVSDEMRGEQQSMKHAIPSSVPHKLISDVDDSESVSDIGSGPQFIDRGDDAQLEDVARPSLASDEVWGEQQGTKHAILSSVPHELVSDVQSVSDIGSGPQPSSPHEDLSVQTGDVRVDTSRELSECGDEYDGSVPQHRVLRMDNEHIKPLPSGQAGAVVDTNETDLCRTCSEMDSPKYDHHVDGIEDEDEEDVFRHDDDVDKVDSATDDSDDITSSQVAPRSVKMQEAVKSRPSSSTASTVVCTRPSRGSGTRTSKTSTGDDGLPETVVSAEVPYGDESDKKTESDDHLKPHGKELDTPGDSGERISGSQYGGEGVDFTDRDQSDLTDEQCCDRAPEDVSCEEHMANFQTFPVENVPSRTVDETLDTAVRHEDEAVESGQRSSVMDNQSIASSSEDLRPSESVEGDRTVSINLPEEAVHASLPGKVVGYEQGLLESSRQDDLPSTSQKDVKVHDESDGTMMEKADSRGTGAELTVLRPWEIRQQVEATDDHRRPQDTDAVGVKPPVLKGKTGDTGVQSVSDAVKTGVLAVVAAPVVAGMAVADALRSATSKLRSQTHNDQYVGEKTRNLTDIEQRILLDDGNHAFESHVEEDLPSQPDRDTKQLPRFAGDNSVVAAARVSLPASVSADVTGDSQVCDFQQPFTDQTSLLTELGSAEGYESRSTQSSVEIEAPLPVVASFQPSQVTTVNTVPFVTSDTPAAVSLAVKPTPAVKPSHSPAAISPAVKLSLIHI